MVGKAEKAEVSRPKESPRMHNLDVSNDVGKLPHHIRVSRFDAELQRWQDVRWKVGKLMMLRPWNTSEFNCCDWSSRICVPNVASHLRDLVVLSVTLGKIFDYARRLTDVLDTSIEKDELMMRAFFLDLEEDDHSDLYAFLRAGRTTILTRQE